MCPKEIIVNNVRFRLVPYQGQDTHPVTGIAFYVNNGQGGVVGVRVYPDGHKAVCNATYCKHENSNKNYCRGQKPYLEFKNAWGRHIYILASRAVYIAWRGKPIPKGMTIDHIDGISTNNDFRNLRCVSNLINNRDGGFSRKLRNKGIRPETYDRTILLRYFDRMVKFKATHTEWQYRKLSREDLRRILSGKTDEAITAANMRPKGKMKKSRKSKVKRRKRNAGQ